MSIKVAVITATRAEYGLLKPLIEELSRDSFFECHLIVTGTHLMEKYGSTIKYIREDNLPIQYEIPIINNDENQSETIANAIVKFSDIYKREKYTAIIILGDRYELYGFCIPAVLQRIPIIHIHGGEKTEGALDEKIRHSITKLSSVHFASLPEYANRILQMGEMPKYVFSVGALGIDNVYHIPLMSKQELEEELGVNFEKENVAIVTFHPVTLVSEAEIEYQMDTLLKALTELPLKVIITMPNSDKGSNIIHKKINQCIQNSNKFLFIKSLGQRRYLSCLKYASIVIGNSSSGIIETASFKIPTVDIGDRQKGRLKPKNVLHCDCEKNAICETVRFALSRKFRDSIKNYQNPYGDGETAQKIKNILKELNWSDSSLIQKEFHDLKFEASSENENSDCWSRRTC